MPSFYAYNIISLRISYICMPSKLHNYIYIFIAYICDIEIAQRSIKWPIDFKVSGSRFKLLQTLTHGPSVVWPIFYYEDRRQNLVQRYLPKNKWPDWFGGNRSRFKLILQIIKALLDQYIINPFLERHKIWYSGTLGCTLPLWLCCP